MFRTVYGVDFSGARLAGRNTWLARLEPVEGGPAPYKLVQLTSLETLCGTAERGVVLAHLVGLILRSDDALWACDFPFGLPVEILGDGAGWADQLAFLRSWGVDDYGAGLDCVRRAEARGGPRHLRRLTDVEEKAPFDPYHYRIIYQTFHGMCGVLDPLRRALETAILPFQYDKLVHARRAVVEACPASTLKRLGLPHQRYKQTSAGRLDPKHLRPRWDILDGLAPQVAVGRTHRRVLMNNNGGDALDAVLAAVGAARSWRTTDHDAVARHPRYGREGRLYV